jgi:hypothetical protein
MLIKLFGNLNIIPTISYMTTAPDLIQYMQKTEGYCKWINSKQFSEVLKIFLEKQHTSAAFARIA